MENNNDLEQMREQLSALKTKLDKEAIINDKMMRNVMKDKVKHLNNEFTFILILAVFSIPYMTFCLKWMFTISWLFIIVTDMFFVAAVVYTYFEYKELLDKHLMEGNLIDVSRKVMRMKRMNANWLKFSIPFIVVWGTWFTIEIMHSPEYCEAVLWGGAIGLVIGLIFGIRHYRNVMRKATDIIKQIDELSVES